MSKARSVLYVNTNVELTNQMVDLFDKHKIVYRNEILNMRPGLTVTEAKVALVYLDTPRSRKLLDTLNVEEEQ